MIHLHPTSVAEFIDEHVADPIILQLFSSVGVHSAVSGDVSFLYILLKSQVHVDLTSYEIVPFMAIPNSVIERRIYILNFCNKISIKFFNKHGWIRSDLCNTVQQIGSFIDGDQLSAGSDGGSLGAALRLDFFEVAGDETEVGVGTGSLINSCWDLVLLLGGMFCNTCIFWTGVLGRVMFVIILRTPASRNWFRMVWSCRDVKLRGSTVVCFIKEYGSDLRPFLLLFEEGVWCFLWRELPRLEDKELKLKRKANKL
nr:hypothetical protein Iba_chr03aCG22120 [Ipomoea batatas]